MKLYGSQAAWQHSHDALQALLERCNAAYNRAGTKEARDTLDELCNVVDDLLTSLNREEIKSHTISLQAASGQLGSGTRKLETLRDELAQISHRFAQAADLVGNIDTALTDMKGLLATFG